MFYLKSLLILLSIISSLSIQANTALEQVGQLSLFTDKPYKVDGQYLYAAGCGGFEVFDLVDPLKPNLLANLPITPNSGDCYSFKLSVGNSYAYLAGWQAIDIIDINIPSKPKRAGGYELPQGNTLYDFMVIGKYGYVVFTNSILVLDLTNPTQPVLAGSKTFPSDNNSVFIKVRINGEQLIVRKSTVNMTSIGYLVPVKGSSTDELLIFSLKDPTKFEQLGYLSLEGRKDNNIRYSADEFQANGQYLYVESLGDILSIDISDPASPQQVGKYSFSDDSTWSADYIVINENFLYFLRSNTNAEITAQDFTHKIFTLDISNPKQLNLVGTYKMAKNNANIQTIDLHKYLRVNNLVLDISQPSQVKAVNISENPISISWGNILIEKDKYVYMASSGGNFSVIDATNPTLPKGLSSITFDELQPYSYTFNYIISMVVDSNYVYFCNSLGMYVIDVSNPSQPKRIGQYLLPTGENCRNISVSGKYAYLIASKDYYSENKIIALDISTPTQPVKIGEYQSTNRHWNKLIVSGEQLYVLAQTTPSANGSISPYLHILNISNPAMLKELANYEPPIFSSDMMLIGQTIYLANSPNLHIVDVSNSSSPKSLGNYNNNSWRNYGGFSFVQAGNNFLYVSDGIGLFKLDVSNSAKPKQIAQIIPPDSTYVLAANEPYVYRLTNASFQIFKSTEVETPQMTQIKGLPNGACDLNLSAKMLGADDGTGKNAGDFYLQWKETGRESMSGGDAVIAGYFYAPSEKVTWGSEANPEVYAKLWFAAGGMLNVNFFHVGVFDVQLASFYGEDMPQLNGGSDLDHNKITIGRKAWRYSRHDYTNWRTCGKSNSALGSLKADSYLHNSLKDMVNNQTKFTTSLFKSPSISAAKITGQTGSCELLIDAKMLNASSNGKPYGNLKLQWKEILRSTTSGGDTVIAGYFYGSPNEVSWGSTTNPEAYVKIWYARTGMLNVNFFHVGVFDIELMSSYKGSVPDGVDGYLTDDNNLINIWSDANRYSRHDYNNWKLCN